MDKGMNITTPSVEIRLPSAPRIEGLRFRRIRPPSDYAALTAVYAACVGADHLDEVVTVEDTTAFLEHPVQFDPQTDLLVAEVDGHIVGYGYVTHRVEAAGDRAERPEGDNASYPEGDNASYPEGNYASHPEGDNASYPGGDNASYPGGDNASYPGGDEVHTHRGYVVPAWRGRGLGSALLAGMVRRAEETKPAAGRPSARWLQSYFSEGERQAHALLVHHGYTPVRYGFKMARDLNDPIPDPALPDGLEIRAAQPDHFRAIWEAEREAFQDHWGYSPWPEESYQRFLAFPHYDPTLWRVAWDGAQVAGSVLSYINADENERLARRRGYTEDISVRRPWRRRGLASALIAASLHALKDQGMTEAALEVDSENPTGALRVYERLGYTTTFRRTLYRKPLTASVQG
jgi:mycothiol synthase